MAELREFQARIRAQMGAELATIESFAEAMGLGMTNARRITAGLRRFCGKCLVDDMSERLYEQFHPEIIRMRRASNK